MCILSLPQSNQICNNKRSTAAAEEKTRKLYLQCFEYFRNSFNIDTTLQYT